MHRQRLLPYCHESEKCNKMTVSIVTFHRLLLILVVLLPALVMASENHINHQDGIAMHGYDPVAYFTVEKAVKGQASLSYEWSDAIWLFSSKQNRQAFIDNPEYYAPQFGGFCAYAASYGQFADIDPMAWSIVNDKLYLNYSLRVRKIWKPRAEEFIGDAEQFWPMMKQP